MIGLISDIHGNYPALKAVLDRLDTLGCKRIYSLGDVAGYYCMINECIEELRNRNIINLMGNHDNYLANDIACERSMTVNNCIAYQREIISEDNLAWLQGSLTHLEVDNLKMVHGGWKDYLDEYVSEFDFLDRVDARGIVFASGHNHIQKKVEGRCGVYVNPGSVGQPRDGDFRAAFAVIGDEACGALSLGAEGPSSVDLGRKDGIGAVVLGSGVRLERVEYDIDMIAARMMEAGFESRLTDCLYTGNKIATYRKGL